MSDKQIKFIIDDLDMLMIRQYEIKKTSDNGYICDGTVNKVRHVEELPVVLKSEKAYDVFRMIKGWGNWNECPNCCEMWNKAREWHEKYGADVVKLAHDTVWFKCARCLNEKEVDELTNDISGFAPNSMDIADADMLKKCLSNKGEFALWWD